MNHKNKLSIIIPTLQEGKLLERVLSQFEKEFRKEHNIELIVSDGGSTDATLEFARNGADVVIEKSGNYKQNISIGRNIGAKAATGEILMFINADTYIADIENFIATIRIAINQPGVAGITCPVLVYPEEESFADKFFHSFLNIYFYTLNILRLGMGRGECQVIKAELFKKLDGYNEKIAAGEDFDLFKRLRRYGKIAFLWNLNVFESPRRYRKSGYLRVIFLWLLNAIAVLIIKRSILNEWKPIR
ncbi:MAG: glycosyltransferase [Bacteroidetes bacterium]|nr:glycosyltransferase [Bacteroidota bacterium]MBU1422288.1 glycosyltransferase [Bacteroidota bacterium]MBU2471083.1 glycosyltransferase [Bacteroidota bacterium]MBU2636574.1 glycosyltransferase [Bacteroidota bacterium]